MNKNITKQIITLATLSFMLTVSYYNCTNRSVNPPQSLINTTAVEQSLNGKSLFDAPESNRTAGTAAVLSAGIVVVGILSLMKAKNSFKPSSTEPHFSSKPNYKSQEKIILLNQASHELQNKLLRLLHGDRQLAMRLLSQVKMKNPDRSINWYVEKVIYDLERDRGRW